MHELLGATVFFRGKGLIARIIQFGTFFQKRDGGFFRFSKWNHVGTVFRQNGVLMLLEAKYPKVYATPLSEVLNTTKSETEIKVLRDPEMKLLETNLLKFNNKCKELRGTNYSIKSAVASGLDFPFDIKDNSKGVHCSHLADSLYKLIGCLPRTFNAKESTPDDTYNHKFLTLRQ